MIVLETAESLDDIDAVLAVEGLDGIYVGPSDLSLSLGRSGPDDRDHMQSVISSIIEACRGRRDAGRGARPRRR